MLNFPDSPTLDQIFTSGTVSWRWDSVKWVVSGSAAPTIITINTGTTLTTGFIGIVRVENTTSAPMTVTMPTSPTNGQEITIKDTTGNAGTYPITVAGGAVNIEASASLVIRNNLGWLHLVYIPTKWVQV